MCPRERTCITTSRGGPNMNNGAIRGGSHAGHCRIWVQRARTHARPAHGFPRPRHAWARARNLLRSGIISLRFGVFRGQPNQFQCECEAGAA